MIYLFNSASRPLYRDNVLEVLALPVGMLILHRYRAGGEYQHVDPELVRAVLRREIRYIPKEIHRLPGDPERVLLVYVDRYAESGYRYHPLRRGLIYSAWLRDDRLYFHVKLQDFAAPASSPASFTDTVRSVLANKNPPRLVPGDPDSFNDGQYALLGGYLPGGTLVTGEQAWLTTVSNLAVGRASGHVPVVFFRSEVHRLGKSGTTAEPEVTGGAARIAIRKDESYALRVTYRAPGHSEVREPLGSIVVDHGPSIQVVGSTSIPIRAEADDITVMVASTRYTDDSSSFVSLRAVADASPRGPRVLLAPSITLPLLLRDPPAYALRVLLAVALFVIGTVLLTVDEAPSWLLGPYLEDEAVLRGVGVAAQAGALFWLFKLTGRKPV